MCQSCLSVGRGDFGGLGQTFVAYAVGFPGDWHTTPAQQTVPSTGITWAQYPDTATELAKLRDEVARLGLTQAQMLDRVSKFLDMMQSIDRGIDDVKHGRVSDVPRSVYAKQRKRKARK